MGNIMNGSEACAFKITFVTKVGTEEDYCYLPFKYYNTFNNAMFKWFWTIFSLGAPVSTSNWSNNRKSCSATDLFDFLKAMVTQDRLLTREWLTKTVSFFS